jgi:cysteine synthase A
VIALNILGATKLARKLGPGKTIVTVICDGGDRARSKLWNPSFLATKGLTPQAKGKGLEWISA